MSSNSTSQFNTGPWTCEEHQNFLRGVEVHGRGNWVAIGMLVRTRNQQQIEAYAVQHFARSTEEQGPAEATTTITGVAVGGGTAATPGSAPGGGLGSFGNGSVLYDFTGVL